MIDVVIPATTKDFGSLDRLLKSVLRHVGPLHHIYVVSSEPVTHPHPKVHWTAEPSQPRFPSLADVRARRPELGARAGWVYQQILKLGAGAYIDGLIDRYLVVDADVVFLRQVEFGLEAGRFPYCRATELNPPYFDAYRRLFREPAIGEYSFTAHHMLYERELLEAMFEDIRATDAEPWYWAYVDAVDAAEMSSINEQDSYGLWVLAHHPELAVHRQLFWKDVGVSPGPLGRAVLGLDFDFVAAHTYARESRAARARRLAIRLASELKAALR
jgi:hypothetical protein